MEILIFLNITSGILNTEWADLYGGQYTRVYRHVIIYPVHGLDKTDPSKAWPERRAKKSSRTTKPLDQKANTFKGMAITGEMRLIWGRHRQSINQHLPKLSDALGSSIKLS